MPEDVNPTPEQLPHSDAEVLERAAALGEKGLSLESSAEAGDVEAERALALDRFIDKYFPDDKEFLEDLDEEDKIGYMYGVIQMEPEKLTKLFREAGIFE